MNHQTVFRGVTFFADKIAASSSYCPWRHFFSSPSTAGRSWAGTVTPEPCKPQQPIITVPGAGQAAPVLPSAAHAMAMLHPQQREMRGCWHCGTGCLIPSQIQRIDATWTPDASKVSTQAEHNIPGVCATISHPSAPPRHPDHILQGHSTAKTHGWAQTPGAPQQAGTAQRSAGTTKSCPCPPTPWGQQGAFSRSAPMRCREKQGGRWVPGTAVPGGMRGDSHRARAPHCHPAGNARP